MGVKMEYLVTEKIHIEVDESLTGEIDSRIDYIIEDLVKLKKEAEALGYINIHFTKEYDPYYAMYDVTIMGDRPEKPEEKKVRLKIEASKKANADKRKKAAKRAAATRKAKQKEKDEKEFNRLQKKLGK